MPRVFTPLIICIFLFLSWSSTDDSLYVLELSASSWMALPTLKHVAMASVTMTYLAVAGVAAWSTNGFMMTMHLSRLRSNTRRIGIYLSKSSTPLMPSTTAISTWLAPTRVVTSQRTTFRIFWRSQTIVAFVTSLTVYFLTIKTLLVTVHVVLKALV